MGRDVISETRWYFAKGQKVALIRLGHTKSKWILMGNYCVALEDDKNLSDEWLSQSETTWSLPKAQKLGFIKVGHTTSERIVMGYYCMLRSLTLDFTK